MEYRKLGESDLEVSVIGFGAWGIGGEPFWKSEGHTASENAIKKAYDLGINFFDTAPVYGFGRSEEIMGKALKGFRDKVIIATKCGLVWEKEKLGSMQKVATEVSILDEVEKSLIRLKTDWIDLYQVHWPDVNTLHEETMGALVKLKEQGKIRHIGVSNYSVDQMKDSIKYGSIVSNQPNYSLLQRSIEKTLVPFCLENNIGIVAYSPLASGLLTGKYDKTTDFTDWRGKGIFEGFTGEGLAKNIAKVDSLKEVAKQTDKSCGQLAINWVVRQPGVTTALVGVKNAQQMEDNLNSVGWEPDQSHQERIEEIFAVK
jgi:aryl-alcohol dehydrogenase-like predicted oxidoreductase